MIDQADFMETREFYSNIGIAISIVIFLFVLLDRNASEYYIDAIRYLDIPPFLILSPEIMGMVSLAIMLQILAIMAAYSHLWVASKSNQYDIRRFEMNQSKIGDHRVVPGRTGEGMTAGMIETAKQLTDEGHAVVSIDSKSDMESLYGFIEDIVGCSTGADRAIKQKLTDFLNDHFVIAKPNTEEISNQLDAMEFPETYKLREAGENLIKAIEEFSAQYEDEGNKFNEFKMQIAIMHMLADEFRKNILDNRPPEDK